jgi:hypothetical protein
MSLQEKESPFNNSPYAERPEGFLEKPCYVTQTFGTVRNIS